MEAPRTTFVSSSLAGWLFSIASIVIIIGILLMTLGSIQNLNFNSANSGAVILIGPIPIIIGAGQYSAELIGLAVVLTIAALVFFFVLRRRL